MVVIDPATRQDARTAHPCLRCDVPTKQRFPSAIGVDVPLCWGCDPRNDGAAAVVGRR